ncbi:NUDIX domain-containing protein [Streptomyces sp. S3(2020)]|uniref:NUDIX domain-containing protein n=1 Tax=Streptomyces sp. S3(2020) TaxID=2732044 RepID=UPI0014886323|nr:NUDIX domain-containing protein [Streptomyces sp. S3(2020)]NNN36238.1 NUDIX domain-containing protein [Streptomyces sp. S3(2020)]
MRVPDSLGQLREWLERSGIPHESWGTGGTKSVQHLWDEIEAGETVLDSEPPLRRVTVVTLRIRQGGKELVEIAQLMADGTWRPRDEAPAEKMKPGEEASATARRCVAEELGVEGPGVVVGAVSERRLRRDSSPSYPGLASEYVFHDVDVRVPGLASGNFWTREAGDGVVSAHLWAWR